MILVIFTFLPPLLGLAKICRPNRNSWSHFSSDCQSCVISCKIWVKVEPHAALDALGMWLSKHTLDCKYEKWFAWADCVPTPLCDLVCKSTPLGAPVWDWLNKGWELSSGLPRLVGVLWDRALSCDTKISGGRLDPGQVVPPVPCRWMRPLSCTRKLNLQTEHRPNGLDWPLVRVWDGCMRQSVYRILHELKKLQKKTRNYDSTRIRT